MSNFGFHDLRLVEPYEPSFREARSAVGGAEVLAQAREFENLADAIADCTLVVGTTSADRRKLEHELKPLGQAAPIIRKSAKRGRVAVLFGSEKRGLSNADFSHCHWLLRVPTREEHGSMNLGQAVAVCLYELVRAHGGKGRPATAEDKANHKASKPASQPALETMTSLLLEVARASGAKKRPVSGEEKIRRMVIRLGLSAEDAALWLSVLRQISWKLKQQ